MRDDGIELTVQDSGIGIPEAEQRLMFDKFFRASNVTVIQGTGLGLHIVKRYVELMGGVIDFSSQENTGTTFRVVFPREMT